MPRLLRSLPLPALLLPTALVLQSCCELACELAYEATTRHCEEDCGDDHRCLSACLVAADRAGCQNECALDR